MQFNVRPSTRYFLRMDLCKAHSSSAQLFNQSVKLKVKVAGCPSPNLLGLVVFYIVRHAYIKYIWYGTIYPDCIIFKMHQTERCIALKHTLTSNKGLCKEIKQISPLIYI